MKKALQKAALYLAMATANRGSAFAATSTDVKAVPGGVEATAAAAARVSRSTTIQTQAGMTQQVGPTTPALQAGATVQQQLTRNLGVGVGVGVGVGGGVSTPSMQPGAQPTPSGGATIKYGTPKTGVGVGVQTSAPVGGPPHTVIQGGLTHHRAYASSGQ